MFIVGVERKTLESIKCLLNDRSLFINLKKDLEQRGISILLQFFLS